MSRSTRMIILAFSGLTLLLAVLSAVFGWPLALGAAAAAGGCAVWAALMSTTGAEPTSAPAASAALAQTVAPRSPEAPAPDPAVVVVVQPSTAPPECVESTGAGTGVVDVAQPVARVVADAGPPATTFAKPEATGSEDEPRESHPAIVMPMSAEPCEVAQALLANAAAAGARLFTHPLKFFF